MPNAIKYTSGNLTGSLQKSTIALGVTTASIVGPSLTTGWYNGITPTPGKYIVFETDISFNPRIYAPQTDAELIRFVRSKGATGNNTASLSASLAWIGTQNNLMAANLEYENIVTSGSVLNLDAGFVGSYPTTGTSMYDLSGNGRNGTLTNGPTFNSANSGFIVFDYTNDFIGSFVNSNLGTPSTFTLSAWVRSSNISLDQNIFNANPPFFLRITSSTIRCCVYTGTWIFVNGSITLSSNTWYNLVLTYDQSTVKGYVNTVLDVNSVKTGSPIWGSLNSIGYTTGGEDAPSVTNIANAMIYNRALTAAEITQNFNAQYNRFGIGLPTNGLIVNLDASNVASYSGTGTTWYDLSGTGNNATLANGVAFSTSYGGLFDFDGVDDYAYITDNATLDLAGDKTQGIWIYMDQSYSGTGMLGKADSSVNGMALSYGWGGGQGFQNIAWNSTNNPTLVSNAADINNWYYIAGVQSGSTRYIYVIGANGFRVASIGNGNHTWNNALNFTIGQVAGYYTNMKAGAVHVYNRALSSSEVLGIYATQKARFNLP